MDYCQLKGAWEDGSPELDLKGYSGHGQWEEGRRWGLRPAEAEVAWMYTGLGLQWVEGVGWGCWDLRGEVAREWKALKTQQRNIALTQPVIGKHCRLLNMAKVCVDIDLLRCSIKRVWEEGSYRGNRILLLQRRKRPLRTVHVHSSFMLLRGLTSKLSKSKLILLFDNIHRHWFYKQL